MLMFTSHCFAKPYSCVNIGIMKALLKFKTKPISTNNAYYSRNNSFNAMARSWRANFFLQMMSAYNQNQIKKITSVFDSKKHMLKVIFTWHQPSDKILTQAGHISSRSMDVDNCLKIPVDCLFDQKYNDAWMSLRKGEEAKLLKSLETSGFNNFSINDKFIFSVTSIKLPSSNDQYHCSVEVDIVDLFSSGK